MALGFINSAEFNSKYGGSRLCFVIQLYQNVLHRAPDSAGEQAWIGQLNGGMSKGRCWLGSRTAWRTS